MAALPKLKPVLIPDGIGEKVDLRTKLKEELAQVTALVAAYEETIKGVETALMTQLDEMKTTNGGGKRATVSIVESVVPSVTDWDAFYAYIAKKKYFHLLERRASVTGCREIFELKGQLPGVEPFVKRKLNFTSKKG